MDYTRFDRDELENQFNPQKSVADHTVYQVHRTALSQICRQVLKGHLDVKYGPGKSHGVDIFPAGLGAPVHMFFHGGYWRAQDKANFAFIARDLLPRGVTVVVVNYDLCPAVTLDGVSSSALSAVEWCYRNIATYGGNPDRISISGNSAGAHLCSMAIAEDWAARGLPSDLIKGAVMISGIFDPAPAQLISVNGELSLTDEIIASNNTEVRPPMHKTRSFVFAGGQEPWAWIEQSFRYSSQIGRAHV